MTQSTQTVGTGSRTGDTEVAERPGELGAPVRPPQRRSASKRVERTVFIILLVISIVMLAPLLWLVLAALKTPAELSAWPIAWLPGSPQWENFSGALTEIPFVAMTLNSTVLSLLPATLTTISSSFVAFGFARLQGWARTFWFGVLVSMMMMPPIVTLIPTYLMMSKVGLVGTYWPWVLWGVSGSAWRIFLFRQQFAAIPLEMQEAARLDGASYFRIWWGIFLPLSKPILVTSFLLGFGGTWGDFITQQLMLTSDNTTLAVGLADGYPNPGGRPQNNLTAAGALLYIMPIVALFFSLRRYYMQTDLGSGMKV
ncbi:carbohydrate ABC transporter permease [Mariniluteicoccus flavus]